jgi:hypothetical protein
MSLNEKEVFDARLKIMKCGNELLGLWATTEISSANYDKLTIELLALSRDAAQEMNTETIFKIQKFSEQIQLNKKKTPVSKT